MPTPTDTDFILMFLYHQVYGVIAKLQEKRWPAQTLVVYANDAAYHVTISVSPQRSTQGDGGTPPALAENILNGLTTLERLVLSVCTTEPQTAKSVARRCQRSLNRVREAVASLVNKALLERTGGWRVRLVNPPRNFPG